MGRLDTLQSDGSAATGLHRDRIRALGPWFHNLHFPDGTETAPDHPLGDFPAFKWAAIAPLLPDDLGGWRILDIGCNAGFYSFAFAARGAEVLAIDHNPHYLAQAAWAAPHMPGGRRVAFRRMSVFDLARLDPAQGFDLVSFMGVFYHLRYPMLGLDIVCRRVSRLLLFQSLSIPDPGHPSAPVVDTPDLAGRVGLLAPGWPKMAFIEGALAGDDTNWWVPSDPCLRAMLGSNGMEVVAMPADETYLCRPDPARRRQAEEAHQYLDEALGG